MAQASNEEFIEFQRWWMAERGKAGLAIPHWPTEYGGAGLTLQHLIAIADERVSEAAKIEQSIPVRIIAGEARHFEAKHDADMSERHLGG